MTNRITPRLCIAQLCSAVLLLALAGCGQLPTEEDSAPVPIIDPAADAQALRDSGDFNAAAERFVALAALASPELAPMYRARAASAYLDAGMIDAARRWMLAADGAAPVSRQVAMLGALNQARVHAAAGEIALAQARIAEIDPAGLDTYHQARAQEVLAIIAERGGNLPAAARIRIALDDGLRSPAVRKSNHMALWTILSQLDSAALAALPFADQPATSGWIALTGITQATLFDAQAFTAAFARWRTQYPDHPAVQTMFEELRALSARLGIRPTRVALLLPYEGRFGAAANAIRDGFLSGWFTDQDNPARPAIVNYTADATNIAAVYRQAVDDGADFIVGPLEKEAVEQLLLPRQPLAVPTLALNVVDDEQRFVQAVANLYQFGLAPEDEAREVARRAFTDANSRIILMVPETPWGTRFSDAFTRQWQAQGGELLDTVVYGGTPEQYASVVVQALNIDGSTARFAFLRRVLQSPMVSQPRRRTDVEAIVLGGFPGDARQILPQLRFQRAERLPVYASSHAYTGTPDPARDQDLDGLIVGDMPSIVRARTSAAWSAITRNWPDRIVNFERLFAFGADAYGLIANIGRLSVQHSARYTGNTGDLGVSADAIVNRQLGWARFRNGVPVPLISAPQEPLPAPSGAQ